VTARDTLAFLKAFQTSDRRGKVGTIMRIFLAPRSNETSHKNFLSTIDNGVDYSIVEPHLDADGRERLSGRSKIFAWGNKETKKTSWEKMQLGDLVLFYKGREGNETEGKLVYAGTLVHKQLSDRLGLSLWPPKMGQEPWSCIFFLDDLRPIFIPISDISDLAGYSRGFVVQGFMPLKERAVSRILDRFGNVERFLAHYSRGRSDAQSNLDEGAEITSHEEAEALLLRIGRMLGYDTYSPDRGRKAYGEKLGDHCTLDKVPTRFLGELVSIIGKIDVIWFEDDVPRFAFEVEHTTKVGAGLQRLFQLNPLSTKMFIVSGQQNLKRFEKFIESAPYYQHKESFYFRSYRQLEEYFRAVSELQAVSRTFLATDT
jgi:hypothetical protein